MTTFLDAGACRGMSGGHHALDFQLSFYMGYIASRNHASTIVVVANDKGYEPMLEHAKAMGFAVRQVGHGQAKRAAPVKATSASRPSPAKPAAKKAAAKKAPATKALAKKPVAKPPAVKQVPAKKTVSEKSAAAPAAKKSPAKKVAPAKKAVTKLANPPAAKKATVAGPSVATKVPASIGALANAVSAPPNSAVTIKKLTDSLRKMGDKRPTKPVSLWRSLKSFLGLGATEEAVEVALARLIEDGVVKVDSVKGASYPKFGPMNGSTVTQV